METRNIRRQFVNITGTLFDWREMFVTNVDCMAALAKKSQGYRVQVYIELREVVILANKEWAAQQTQGTEIRVAHCKIFAKYKYNHRQDTHAIREFLKILATADASRDHREKNAPGESADMFSQDMTRLQHLVKHQPVPHYKLDSYEESANSTTTSDSEGLAPRRRRRKHKEKNHSCRSSYPYTLRSRLPPVRRKRSTECRACGRTKIGRDDSEEKNLTG